MASKYFKGRPMLTTPETVAAILNQQFLYQGDKFQNFAWLQNMSIRTIDCYVRAGRLWYAIKVS